MAKRIKRKNYISPVESTIQMLFYIFIFSILYLSPQIIGIYYKSNGEYISIPIFNLEVLGEFKVFIIIMLVLSVLKESLKIIWRKWNLKNSIIYSGLNITYNCLFISFLSRIEIWNEEFTIKIQEYLPVPFEVLVSGIIFIIIASVIIETIVLIFRGVRSEIRNN